VISNENSEAQKKHLSTFQATMRGE